MIELIDGFTVWTACPYSFDHLSTMNARTWVDEIEDPWYQSRCASLLGEAIAVARMADLGSADDYANARIIFNPVVDDPTSVIFVIKFTGDALAFFVGKDHELIQYIASRHICDHD